MMPKAAIYEDHRLETGQHEIRSAGKLFDLQAEPIPVRMQKPSSNHLGSGVPLSYTTHHPTSFGLGENV
jgi:hypothetical protein